MIWLLGIIFQLHASIVQPIDYPESNKQYTELLQKYVSDSEQSSKVNYKDWSQQDRQKLNIYTSSLQRISQKQFDTMNKDQQMAFLINAYNAFTLQLILKHYPVKSIKKIGAWYSTPWKIDFFNLLGKKRNIDWIEHKMLRPKYNDFRVHFAVNCASIGCPKLRNEAYQEKELQAQLNDQMKSFMTDKSRNFIKLKTRTLHVSKIFDWFKEDFKNLRSLLATQLTTNPELRKSIVNDKWGIKYTDYNWQLNE